MRLGNLKDEWEEFGFSVVAEHIKSKLTGDSQTYLLKRQEVCSRMTLPEIEKNLKRTFKKVIGRDLNLQNPKSFDEKIQWLKIYDATPLKTKLSDKYLVRSFVEERTGRKDILVPLLGAWDSFDDIDFSKLPDQFALKTNHGSGMNFVVSDKKNFDVKAAKAKFDFWMKLNFFIADGW